jgi:hypothetical protein
MWLIPTFPIVPIGLNALLPRTLTGFTCKLSTVNGTAFITQPNTDLSAYVGRFLTLTAGGKTLTGWAKAAGTAETLGDAKNVSNCVNDAALPFSTFSGASATGFHAHSTGDAGGRAGTADEITWVAGELQKVTFTHVDTSGMFATYFDTALDGSDALRIANGTSYTTMPSSQTGVVKMFNGDNAEFTISNLAVKQVLAPGATGLTIVSAKGGTTYNWTSKEVGFDENAASFTLTIEEGTDDLDYLTDESGNILTNPATGDQITWV